MSDNYYLDVPNDNTTRKQIIAWLTLALASLVIGGLFVILLVLSRTPGIQNLIPWIDFFQTALVVHVNMTVLVWFIAFAGVLWSMNSVQACINCGWLPIIFVAVGMLGISISPFLGTGNPIMNNYVPVLRNPAFFISLCIFGIGFSLQILNSLFYSRSVGKYMDGSAALRFGLFSSLIAALFSVLSLGWSFLMIPENIQGKQYFELLFWGGGHILQFTHTQLMLVVWFWLASVSGVKILAGSRVTLILFALGVAPVFLTPAIYIAYPVDSPYHSITFTLTMKYGGGLAVLPLGLMLLVSLKESNKPPTEFKPERSALVFSILLFGVGGVIGALISGSDVRIPAHYHGSIVGVTMAFMGITYHILPKLGFRKPVGKWALRQPTIYGVGQLTWVLAMAYTGGHGVQRKIAGEEQGLQTVGDHIAMGIMGIGGIIAIIGGIIYLVVVFNAMRVRS